VGVTLRVGLGVAEGVRVGVEPELAGARLAGERSLEDQFVPAAAVLGHVNLQLGSDLGAQLESTALPVLGVLLDLGTGRPRDGSGLHRHESAADGQHPGSEFDVAATRLDDLPHGSQVSTAVSTSSWDCRFETASYSSANCSGVRMVRGLTGADGI
jgi:hypothetical protein